MHHILKIWSFLLCITISPFVSLSIENYPAGARPLALSNAFISLSGPWAVFHNQSGLASINNISAGFHYESRFCIDKLSQVAGSIVLPVRAGTFGLSFLQFGKGSYKEGKYAIAFARQLSKIISAGIQLDYFTQAFPGKMQSRGSATFEGGIIIKPLEKLYLGTHIFNPLSRGLNFPEGTQKMPVTIRAGGHYLPEKNILLIFEAEKDNLHPALLKTAIEYIPVEDLAIRFGVSGKPFRYTTGIGYRMNKITTDIGFGYHETLGLTPSVSIQFQL